MHEDPEVRELRDRVRMLEGQLASNRRGAGPAGCVIAAIAVFGVLIVGGGAAGFLFFAARPASAPDRDQAQAQAEADAARRAAQAQSEEQIAVLQAQLAQAQAAAAAAGASGDPLTTYVDDDAVYDGRVTATEGSSHVHVGDTCRVDIEWTTDPSRYCRALVDCGERHMYGDVHQGWFPCTVNADDGLVRGEDTEPTPTDGDPRITIDRVANRVTIADESPSWSVTMTISARPEEE